MIRSYFPGPGRIACTAIVLGVLATGLPGPTLAQSELQPREVAFLTLRNRTGSADPGEAYGGERSDMKAGWCGVRKFDFDVFSSIADAAPAFVQEEFLRVAQVREMPADALLESLQPGAEKRAPALYVHGYAIGFEKGCRRAALFQENANLDGRLLWFSWPSDGALANYTQDEADLYWSVLDLADSIAEMERRYGSGAVDVIGHSLGARGVVLALYELANRNPDLRLDDVALIAPDVDFAIFAKLLPRIGPLAARMTVYVTDNDRPLALSAQLHGYPRLGEANNDVSELEGVEVIDLSGLSSEGPTGHIYHILSEDAGVDLDILLNEGKSAAERDRLAKAGSNLWRLQRSEPNEEN